MGEELSLKDTLHQRIKGRIESINRIITEEQGKTTRIEFLNPGNEHIPAMMPLDKICFRPDLAYSDPDDGEDDDAENFSDVLEDKTAIGFVLLQKEKGLFSKEKLVAYVLGSQDSEVIPTKDKSSNAKASGSDKSINSAESSNDKSSSNTKAFYLNSDALLPELKEKSPYLFPALISIFEKAVKIAGYDEILLHALDDPAVIDGYKKLGYQQTEFLQDYHADENEDPSRSRRRSNINNDAWLMRKILTESSSSSYLSNSKDSAAR